MNKVEAPVWIRVLNDIYKSRLSDKYTEEAEEYQNIVPVGTIADKLKLSENEVARSLDILEAQGLIESPNKSDSNRELILTEKGFQIVQEYRGSLIESQVKQDLQEETYRNQIRTNGLIALFTAVLAGTAFIQAFISLARLMSSITAPAYALPTLGISGRTEPLIDMLGVFSTFILIIGIIVSVYISYKINVFEAIDNAIRLGE